jgi:CheY-like chemotaxis protein
MKWTLRNAIVAYLTQDGYEVHAASNGEEALERVKSVPFDILITDMKLPGIDGTAVLQEALALYPELIGIIITGMNGGKCRPGDEEGLMTTSPSPFNSSRFL